MKVIYYFLVFLLLNSLANATIIEQDFEINNRETNVNLLIDFESLNNFNFYLDLPEDVYDLKILLDDEEKEFELITSEFGSIVNINGSAEKLNINYNTRSYIEKTKKYYFTAEVLALFDSDLTIKITLPEGATLDKQFNNVKETSVYPNPDDIETNGKNIIIIWNYDSNKDETFPFFIIYNVNEFNYLYLILLVIVIIPLTYFLIKKNKKVRIIKIKESNPELHLKEEEKIIVNILKQKQGQCEQATLVTLTNMSKASLSRLLNELESRNILYKEQKGNKNLVILKKR